MTEYDVIYNGTTLNSANLRIGQVNHEDQAKRNLNLQSIAGRDGLVLVDDQFGEKIVTITGLITGDSDSDLDARIIALHTLFSAKEKILEVDYERLGIQTLQYVATPQNFIITRRNASPIYARFTVEFVVPTGVGKDDAVNNISEDNMTSDGVSFTAAIVGSADPQPILTFTVVDSNALAGIRFQNATTGTAIRVDATYEDDDILVIDCGARTVQVNSIDVDFTGVFPTFDIGNNSILVNYYRADVVIDEEQTSYSPSLAIHTTDWAAQSFQIDEEVNVHKVALVVRKDGSPPFTSLDLRIETDVAGDPSGVLAHANATASVNVADITNVTGWVDFVFAAIPVLSLATTYWLVIKPSAASGDAGNNIASYYQLAPGGDLYTDGQRKFSADAGANWIDNDNGTKYDQAFKIYTSSGGALSFDVDLDIDYQKTYH